MSIYTMPISQLSPSDLQELIDESAVENLRLEFKREYPSKDNTVKKISSFANTFGGFIVVGAEEDGKGRLKDLCGVDEISGYKDRLA